MIIPDVNLLVYAAAQGTPEHARARAWWESTLGNADPVGLTPPVVFGFLRLTTHRRVLVTPMTLERARGFVLEWLARPAVEYLRPGPRHLGLVLDLLVEVGSAGNLTTDAQIAASALEHNAVVASNDADFARFPGLRWTNPLRD